MSYKRFLKSFAIVLVLAVVAGAQDLASFEKRTTVKTLDNGLTVVICERPEAPVFSFFTHVDAGSVQDPLGQTGLAHMFEHMAFKGTDKIGTTDYAAEKVALEKVEQVYAAYIAERDKPVGRDEQKLKELQKAWMDAVAEANKYVKPNEFPQIVENNGGEDLNANTADDETNYFYSFPENRLELWAYLESERFLHPVMREFYKEPNVGFADLVDAVDRAKQFTPVVVSSLINSQIVGQTLVAAQAADQVRLGPRLNHFQFLVADVFVFQLLNLDVNGIRHFVWLVAGERKCIKGK